MNADGGLISVHPCSSAVCEAMNKISHKAAKLFSVPLCEAMNKISRRAAKITEGHKAFSVISVPLCEAMNEDHKLFTLKEYYETS